MVKLLAVKVQGTRQDSNLSRFTWWVGNCHASTQATTKKAIIARGWKKSLQMLIIS